MVKYPKGIVKKALKALVLFKMTCQVRKMKEDGVNVLCLVPAGYVAPEKVIWDIVNGLKPDRYYFHLLGKKGGKSFWCRDF